MILLWASIDLEAITTMYSLGQHDLNWMPFMANGWLKSITEPLSYRAQKHAFLHVHINHQVFIYINLFYKFFIHSLHCLGSSSACPEYQIHCCFDLYWEFMGYLHFCSALHYNNCFSTKLFSNSPERNSLSWGIFITLSIARMSFRNVLAYIFKYNDRSHLMVGSHYVLV